MNLTSKNRTTPRAEDTRRKIYDAAMELFREKGFEQTTMRDIAAKAGVALGGAYYYYSSKDAIVLAFYREMQESSQEAILEALRGARSSKTGSSACSKNVWNCWSRTASSAPRFCVMRRMATIRYRRSARKAALFANTRSSTCESQSKEATSNCFRT